mgnify:CR=1 FL=1
MTHDENPVDRPASETGAPVDDGRREAMRKLGKGIAYAAPLTIGLMKIDKAAAAS